MKKFFLIGLLLILFATFASAEYENPDTSLLLHWDDFTIPAAAINSSNWPTTNPTVTVAGGEVTLTESGSGDASIENSTAISSKGSVITIALKMTQIDNEIYTNFGLSPTRLGRIRVYDTGQIVFYNSGGTNTEICAACYSTGDDLKYTYNSTAGTAIFYVNNVSVGTQNNFFNSDMDGTISLRHNGGVGGNTGKIDYIYIWNGTKDQFPYIGSETFELTASNSYNGSTISSFNATFINETSTENIGTTNGSIFYYPNLIYNITINSTDYFPRTYVDYNTSANLNAPLTQAYLNLILTNLANTTQYSDVTWTINNTDENISISKLESSSIANFNVTSGNYTILAEKDGYPNTVSNITLNPLDNKTIYLSIGFFAELNLIDEATMEAFNVSKTNSTKVTVVCADIGSFEYDLNESTQNISISCEYTKLRFTVTYDDTVYTRNLLSSETDVFSQDVYLIDLTTTQSLYNAFIVNDYVGEYTNPKLYILKNMEGSQVIIHSDDLDVENKMSVYLIENDEYILQLRSDNNPTEVLGFYGADISGTKEITVTTANTDLSDLETAGTGIYITTYAKNVSNDLYAYGFYSDSTASTTQVTWSLFYFNDTNSLLELIYNVTTSGAYGNLSFTPYNISTYRNYTVFSGISYVKDGSAYIYYRQINDKVINKRNDTLFGFYAVSVVQWGVVIFLSIIALSGTITTQNYVNYVIIGAAGLAVLFNLMNISIILLALGLIVNFMYTAKTADETRIAR